MSKNKIDSCQDPRGLITEFQQCDLLKTNKIYRHIRYSSGPIVIAIRQKLSFQSRPWADWYFNHSSVFLVWSSSQSQGWIFCSKFKTCPRWYVKILDFGQNIHPCDWDHDQTRNALQWLKYQSALGLDRKRNFCLIAITIVPEEYLIWRGTTVFDLVVSTRCNNPFFIQGVGLDFLKRSGAAQLC